MRLWHFSSSVNSFFKRQCAANPMGLDVWCLVGTLHLLPYFMCANSEGSGETARMRRLAWAFAGRLWDSLVAYGIITIISWADSFLLCFVVFVLNGLHYTIDAFCWGYMWYLDLSTRKGDVHRGDHFRGLTNPDVNLKMHELLFFMWHFIWFVNFCLFIFYVQSQSTFPKCIVWRITACFTKGVFTNFNNRFYPDYNVPMKCSQEQL